ncbi:hypothetical protein HNR25_005107 [Streptomonospora salina]|uniref:DUF3071 domain-containing protein n=2 Tax=Streptomonospora salina TaxID=104205 RepID=A0A841EKG9_9ACTN|nr:septation protein SepH [Streptomonospora salina]MBB6001278.1 hypothetical protein [Streptomonospora salina]
MQELRLAAVSEDGTYLVLASAGRGTRFTLPVDDRLRAAVRGQFSRLGQDEIEVENPLRPKEIQARIRSGETAETIADLSGIPIERVRWFESPVLQEREYVAQQAQRASVRRQGESAPGPVLGDLIAERIGQHQLETGDAVWDSWKREDGTWQLRLIFYAGGEERAAHWIYEPRRRSVTPADGEAVRFLTREADEPLDLGPGSANVTPFVPRRQGSAPESRPEPPRPEPGRPDGRTQEPGLRTAPTDPPRSEEPPAPAAPAASAPSGAPDRPAPAGPPERSAPARTRITPDRAVPPAQDAAPQPAAARQQREEGPAPVPEAPAAGSDPAAPPASAEAPERPGDPERSERPDPPEQPQQQPEPSERRGAGRAALQSPAPPAAQRPDPVPASAPEQDDSQELPSGRRPEPPVSAAAAGTGAPGGGSASRRKGRGRRASVPSWDEIMFGSKKSD